MVEGAQEVVGFVGDGGDDLGVSGICVEIDEGVVGFVLVVGVDGFGESCEVPVGVKGCGFADKNGGVFACCGALSYKNDVLRSVFFVEGSYDVVDAFFCQRGMLHFHSVKA